MKKLLLLLLMVVCFVGVVEAVNINSCTDINAPGNYELTTSFFATKNDCINITKSNVTLDCKNYIIDGDSDTYKYCIRTQSTTNVTVKNCFIQDCDSGIVGSTSYFLLINSTIYSMTQTSIEMSGHDVYIFDSYIDGGTNILVDSYNSWLNNSIINGVTVWLYGDNATITNNYIINDRIDVQNQNDLTISNNIIINSICVNFDEFLGTNNKIYNNYFNCTTVFSGTIDNSNPKYFNTSKTVATNLIGGTYIGGNYYTKGSSSRTGYSDTCTDANDDGLCDYALNISNGVACTLGTNCGSNYDAFPLTYVFADYYPYFITIPANVTLQYGEENLNVDFNSGDDYSTPTYSINDTTRFTINAATGILTNKTKTPIGIWIVNVTITDSEGKQNSTMFKDTVVDTLAPRMNIPANQTLYKGVTALSVSFASTDASGISQYNINDTTRFKINGAGLLENNTALDLGSYTINVSVNDTTGLVNFSYFGVNVIQSLNITIELDYPGNGNQLATNYITFKFTPTVKSGSGIQNCSVYTNSTGTWAKNMTNSSALTSEVQYVFPTILLENNNYKWNVLCVDETNTETWALSNYTFKVLYSTAANFYLDNCTLFSTTALRFRIRNITNNALVNGTMEFEFNYTDGVTYKTYNSISDNDNIQDFCIAPNDAVLVTDFQVDYYISGGAKFTYLKQNLEISSTLQTIDLFITEDGTLTLMSVVDDLGEAISGVYIKIQEYIVGEGVFRENAIVETDYNGEATSYLKLYDTWYKFILTYNNEVVLNTEPSKVNSNSITFVINILNNSYLDGMGVLDAYTTLTWDNTTKYFTYTYDVLTSGATGGTLELWSNTQNGMVLLNTSTLVGSSGTIMLPLNNVSSDLYTAKGFLTISGSDSLARTLSKSFDYSWQTYGQYGLFLTFIIMATVTMIGLWHPAVAIVLMIVSFLVSYKLNFIHLEWGMIMAFILMGILVLVRMNRR